MVKISRNLWAAALFAASATGLVSSPAQAQEAPFRLAISGFELMGENCPDKASTQVVLSGTAERPQVRILFPGPEGSPAMTPGFTVTGADAVSACSVAINVTQMGVPKINLRVVSAVADVRVNNPSNQGEISVTGRFRVNEALSAPRTGLVTPVMMTSTDPMTADTAQGQLGRANLSRVNVVAEVMAQGTLTFNLQVQIAGGSSDTTATLEEATAVMIGAVDAAG
jgi:hypothetical protein